MTDREAELETLAERACEYDAVADAFVAKSFTDRQLVVDLESADSDVPSDLIALFEEHGCYGTNEVYDCDAADGSSAGAFGDTTRRQFVDSETRGEHQSYVVD
ncbi:hypothetical protein [Halobellus ordinarius]|uniref:hypothetical protein n=1 Tax=Halobellus ordinarius TaxID=3075120 RepID=UPI0028806D7E|nr:hypothetical protein [Halobellus sp. ZY16]